MVHRTEATTNSQWCYCLTRRDRVDFAEGPAVETCNVESTTLATEHSLNALQSRAQPILVAAVADLARETEASLLVHASVDGQLTSY